MKLVLLVVGKTDVGYWKDALDDYSERLRHYIPFEIEVMKDLKDAKNKSEAQQKELEGRLIIKSLRASDVCVLLDERGKAYASKQFASYLEKKMQTTSKRIVFIIGGPYGLSNEMFERFPEWISLSKMTFSHQMIRPFFVEQLYRAMTILRGEAYHH